MSKVVWMGAGRAQGTITLVDVQYRGSGMATCFWHVGQVCLLHSHSSMHSLWKLWEQWSSLIPPPPLRRLSWQIRHKLSASLRDMTLRLLNLVFLSRGSCTSGMVGMACGRLSHVLPLVCVPASLLPTWLEREHGLASPLWSQWLRWPGLGATVAECRRLRCIAFSWAGHGSEALRLAIDRLGIGISQLLFLSASGSSSSCSSSSFSSTSSCPSYPPCNVVKISSSSSSFSMLNSCIYLQSLRRIPLKEKLWGAESVWLGSGQALDCWLSLCNKIPCFLIPSVSSVALSLTETQEPNAGSFNSWVICLGGRWGLERGGRGFSKLSGSILLQICYRVL